jgi:hypothetical protein
MKNTPQTTPENNTSSLDTNLFEKFRNTIGRNVRKEVAIILFALVGYGCGSDGPGGSEPIEPEPVKTTKYESKTTITPNAIEENKTGKIGTVNTDVYKVTLVDGVETSRETVTNANISYTDLENGQKMVGKEIHLEDGHEADHENADGSDKTDPKVASFVKAMVSVDGKNVESMADADSDVVDVTDFTPTVAEMELTDKNGDIALMEDDVTKKIYQKYNAIIAQYNINNMAAINNNDVQEFIDASNGAFVAENLNGWLYAKIVAGPQAGKYIARGDAHETAAYAISEILDTPTTTEFATEVNENLGHLYGLISQKANAFTLTYTNPTTGAQFVMAKENDEISAVAGILTAKKFNEELLPEE